MAIPASYSFLPWARQGIAGRISEEDTLGLNDGNTIERAVLKASVELSYTTVDNSVQGTLIEKDIRITGPGDITGLSAKNIVRTEPQSGITNFEANVLAYIEFYEEDFPWRYTPARANAITVNSSRLRPWLVLLALKNEEFKFNQNPGGNPFITVSQDTLNNAFPHEKDCWAFAHVHVNNRLASLQGITLRDELAAEIAGNPDVAVSRLLCSRKLQKDTGYTAFLLPAFESGRLRGLRLDIAGVKAQAAAWKKGIPAGSSPRPFDFPVYHQWTFRTAAGGDFEALAAKLKPAVLNPASGTTPMNIGGPGYNLAATANGTKSIGFEAALKPPFFKQDPWPANTAGVLNSADEDTIRKLKQLLSLSAEMVQKDALPFNNPFFNSSTSEDPLLVPPVYGAMHAGIEKLSDEKDATWVETLNLDFRHRAAAGLGRKLLQQRQEEFMNRAWQQVSKVKEANRLIQQAALSSLVNTAILKKHIVNGGSQQTLTLTQPVQHLIRSNLQKKQTVRQDFADSRIPVAAQSAAFRKLTRPFSRTPMAAFQSLPQATTAALPLHVTVAGIINVLQRFNADAAATNVLAAAKLKEAPEAAMKITTVKQSMDAALGHYSTNVFNLAKDQFIKLLQSTVAGAPLTKAQLLQFASNMQIPVLAVKIELSDWINNITIFPIVKTSGFILVQLADTKFKKIFGDTIHSTRYNDIIIKDGTAIQLNNLEAVKTITVLDDLKNMQSSFDLFHARIASIPVNSALPALNQFDELAKMMVSKLDPAVTITKKLAATIKVFQGGQYLPLQQLMPVMAYPEFTESVYSYLLEMSKNYLLPNMNLLPENSITVLENNQSFIESFMAGLNHEMAKELLWREFPTDQRGSYFRQFWSVKDDIFNTGKPDEQTGELQKDIKKIHEWDKPLGQNTARITAANLVLVVRGELLRKFPNAMIYAQQAAYDSNNPSGPRKLKAGLEPAITKFPLFKAEIDPDITIIGFDLGAEEARGEKIQGKNPGWFFVFKERPGQVRFGMDDFGDESGQSDMPTGIPESWDGLAWEHLVKNKNELSNYHINFLNGVNIKNPAGQPVWGTNAADMAAILFQNPVLFARHAAEMLAEE